MRNAVCTGAFNALLHELNADLRWRKILGKDVPDTRMRDVELILRFFAFRYAVDRYEKPMKDFLSRYMRRHAQDADEQIARYRDEFTGVLEAVTEHLPERPFHIYAGFNSSAFDSVFSAFALHLDDIPDDVTERYERLSHSDEFEDLVKGGTTDVEQVRGRIRLAENALFG